MRVVETAEVERFLGEMLPRQLAAERALCSGDAEARTGTWSRTDPVTLFGAFVALRRGWNEVSETFDWLAGTFSEKQLLDYDFELLAAGAYTVGFEHKTFISEGKPASYTLRVTHVYRREAGEWRIVHRHGDYPPNGLDASNPSAADRTREPSAGPA
jgi:ketosteroid isomerase-like protein